MARELTSLTVDAFIRGDNAQAGGRTITIGRQDVFGREDQVKIDVPRARLTVDGLPLEFVANVKVYGAKGDGTTDDTAAIQAAMDSGAAVIEFPEGVYLLTANVTIPNDVTINAQRATITASGPYRLTFEGTVGGGSSALYEDAIRGNTVIKVATKGQFAADDWVVITDDSAHYANSTKGSPQHLAQVVSIDTSHGSFDALTLDRAVHVEFDVLATVSEVIPASGLRAHIGTMLQTPSLGNCRDIDIRIDSMKSVGSFPTTAGTVKAVRDFSLTINSIHGINSGADDNIKLTGWHDGKIRCRSEGGRGAGLRFSGCGNIVLDADISNAAYRSAWLYRCSGVFRIHAENCPQVGTGNLETISIDHCPYALLDNPTINGLIDGDGIEVLQFGNVTINNPQIKLDNAAGPAAPINIHAVDADLMVNIVGGQIEGSESQGIRIADRTQGVNINGTTIRPHPDVVNYVPIDIGENMTADLDNITIENCFIEARGGVAVNAQDALSTGFKIRRFKFSNNVIDSDGGTNLLTRIRHTEDAEISGNRFVGSKVNHTHNWSNNTRLTIAGNYFGASSDPLASPSGNNTYAQRIRYGAVFGVGDATPSVADTSIDMFRTANTSPTTITDFDDGTLNQKIIVHVADANTGITGGSGIKLDAAKGNYAASANGAIFTFTYDGTDWLEISRSSSGSRVANVRQFGAVGDGVTDDTTAIQAAMDAAKDAGALRVLIPAGTYLISSTITLPLIEGSDSLDGVVYIQGDGAKIKTTSDITMWRLPETANTSGFRAPIITGVMFEGNSQANQIAINLQKTYLPAVRDCRFLNVHTCILGEFVIGLEVKNCHMRYCETLVKTTSISGVDSTYAIVSACRAFTGSATAVPFDIDALGSRLESCIAEGQQCDTAFRMSGSGIIVGCHCEATTVATLLDLELMQRSKIEIDQMVFGTGSTAATMIDLSRTTATGGAVVMRNPNIIQGPPTASTLFKHTDAGQSSGVRWVFEFGGLPGGGSSGGVDWLMDAARWDSGQLPRHLSVEAIAPSNGGTVRFNSGEYVGTFSDGDATPNVMVEATQRWKTANTVPTTITDFDIDGNAYPSDLVVHVADANTGITGGSGIKLDSSRGNYTASANGAIFTFTYDGTNWLEISRSEF